MQGLPTPPTDNLYKFVAVSGVVVLIAALFGGLLREQQYDEWYAERVRVINQQYYGELFSRPVEFAKISDKLTEEYHLLEEEANQRHKYMYMNSILCIVGMVLGIVTAFGGFLMWFRKHQWYQDQMLRLEYEKVIRDHEAEKATTT